MTPGTGVVVGGDGVARCPWGASTPDYAAYHDTEWGRPVARRHRDLRAHHAGGVPVRALLAHDPAQARRVPRGLRRLRPRRGRGVRRDRTATGCSPTPASCATAPRSTPTITNARAALDLIEADGDGALDRLVWGFAPRRPAVRLRSIADLAGLTPESLALAKELKRRGFVFVGPTTMYAAMQAMGLVDDHLEGCDATAA